MIKQAGNGGSDAVDVVLSSNVTVDNVGVVSRRITSLRQAVRDNGDSRVFGGVSCCGLLLPPHV